MATYIYESTDATKPVRHFELQQSMKDAPLTRHPETGETIRSVITGGYGVMSKDAAPGASSSGGGHSCSTGGCRYH